MNTIEYWDDQWLKSSTDCFLGVWIHSINYSIRVELDAKFAWVIAKSAALTKVAD